MLNTLTLFNLYVDFCNEDDNIQHIPSTDEFVRLVTNNGLVSMIFLAYVVAEGYDVDQIEEWEKEVFSNDPEIFFKDVESALQLYKENL
ncbi:hypothetical protein [Vibrio phage RYC]|nr:hypothetical protein [Vibrio phage RYC]